MMIQPINDNIVIKLPEVEIEQKTTSGILIANAAQGQPRPDRGEVVAVGEGRITSNGDLVKLTVQTGDQILFNKFAGTEIHIGEDKFLIIKECDILAKLK